MIDLHTHLWPHEPGTTLPTYDELARFCERASSLGVQQIAITEHCNRFEEIAKVALPLWRRDDTPSLQDPGSKDRGSRLFASERQGTPSGIQQNIPINEEWRSAINEGRVAAHLSAFLGGNRTAQDRAMVKVTFFDANRRPLGETFLPAVGPRERQDKTGLLPVETNNMVPAGTARVNLELAFGTDQARGVAYADNLELIFSEYLR